MVYNVQRTACYIMFEKEKSVCVYIYITMMLHVVEFSTLDGSCQNNPCPLNSLDDENIVGQPRLSNECNSPL